MNRTIRSHQGPVADHWGLFALICAQTALSRLVGNIIVHERSFKLAMIFEA